MPQDRVGLHFLLHAMCNRVQREVLSMVKNRLLGRFPVIFPDFTGVKTPKVGRGTSGQPLPDESHLGFQREYKP